MVRSVNKSYGIPFVMNNSVHYRGAIACIIEVHAVIYSNGKSGGPAALNNSAAVRCGGGRLSVCLSVRTFLATAGCNLSNILRFVVPALSSFLQRENFILFLF